MSGLRTERVTLEVTYNQSFFSPPTKRWAWESLLRLRSNDGESVRVVEEAAIDPGWAERLEADRDAAIRERDAAREECEKLRERVARLESAANPRPEPTTGSESVAPAIDPGTGWRLLAHDEVIEQGDEWLLLPAYLNRWEPARCRGDTPQKTRETYRRRVVADATIGSGDVFADVGCGSQADEIARLTAERDAAIRERDAAREECERLKARVAELEAAPAARHLYDIGHKISPFMTLSSGPDGCILEMRFKSHADGSAFHGAVVKFFTTAPAANAGGEQPQPPRGWLTADERDAVAKCLRHFVRQEIEFLERNDPGHRWLSVWRQEEATLLALLARSTPPRVKLPPEIAGMVYDAASVRNAIRAAGGEVE